MERIGKISNQFNNQANCLLVMPELPEVQTTVNYLKPRLVGLHFKDVWSDWKKTLKQAGGVVGLNKEIKGKKIVNVYRRAKFIVVDIKGDRSIFIHQKISGHLLYGKWIRKSEIRNPKWISAITGPLREDRKNQYLRVVFGLSNGYQLALSDLRRFGKIVLVKDKDVSNLKEIRDLGPEPLDITFNQFKSLFRGSTSKQRKRGYLKQVLMDPFFIVGIGNIYSDEIFWKAGLHPLSRVENLDDEDLKKIYKYMKEILKRAIKYGGSSVDDYRLPSGEKGEFQNMQFAYHQTGKRCAKKDGGVIERIKVGGRSAHFCLKHQILR